MINRPRILVVDSDDRCRRILKKLLEADGYYVTSKTTGAEALASHIKQHFPLVVTDVEIQDMTGIELLQLVKAQHALTEVVVMNSHGSLDTAINAMRAGAYDYLLKPFKSREIISNIARRALEKFKLRRQNETLIVALKQHNKALEATNTRLKKLAIHDDLTGLFNHRYFQERLKLELNRAKRYPKPFSILFIDLDYFKIYNDTNGHLAGDRLLKTLADLFMKSLRKTDMVARYGGDEFVVILPETPKVLARFIAAKLHQQIARYPFKRCEKMPDQHITISIGLATYPQDGTTPNALLHHADHVLYNGKKNRGQFTVSESMQPNIPAAANGPQS